MDNHLLQVTHNEGLLAHLETTCPRSFNDWKVTLVYYIALHQMRAFGKFMHVSIGRSHKDLEVAMKNQGASVPNLDVDRECADSYMILESVSRAARYDGIDDPSIFEHINGKRLSFSKLKLQKIKNHLEAKGLPL
jgi:hypothetical protein